MPLWLYETATQSLAEAHVLQIVTDQQMTSIDQSWDAHNLVGFEHSHWDWKSKYRHRSPETLIFGLECKNEIQALMFLLFDKMSHEDNLPLVYVDYLATAPWNQGNDSRFKRSGTLLIYQAIQESLSRGWQGRMGLHSLPQARGFYLKWGMIDLGEDPRYDDLDYFEMRASQATHFLENFNE
ncbi:GNAT family N-acetyltransferase [Armatimonas sp.]|uniref:GNAT family N-acetyltransferase n=1 Tax=Armatimonas sp. TaxID=1872638 RepID=UPI003752253C